MSISYYMLPLFISIIMQSFFWHKELKIKYKIFKYIIYFIIFYKYIYFYLVFASRGAIISALVCIFICFIVTRKSKIKKMIYFFIGVLSIIILCFYMESILNMTNNMLNTFNIYSRTIERTIDLVGEENIGNGRDAIYTNAFNEIQQNFIFGNGIGEFYNTYGTYPHNIFLQSWHEGGIFYMILIMIPIIYSIYIILFCNKTSKEKKYILIFLFSISLVRLMISYEYWKDNYFWIYLYIVILPNIVRRSEINGYGHNSHIQKSE